MYQKRKCLNILNPITDFALASARILKQLYPNIVCSTEIGQHIIGAPWGTQPAYPQDGSAKGPSALVLSDARNFANWGGLLFWVNQNKL